MSIRKKTPRSAPKINQLARRGFRANHELLVDSGGRERSDIQILGRRARKEWPCSSGDACAVGVKIDFDEIYVELAEGDGMFNGRPKRYHLPCALRAQVIEEHVNPVDQGNNRRAAIELQKAKQEAQAREC